MLTLAHLKEAKRIFKRARHVNKHGFNKFNGSAEEICKQIIHQCYNGSFFNTSLGHFCQFYTRDFGFCVESLVSLGYQKKAKDTIEYALSVFYKHNTIATTITPEHKPLHIFDYSPDSLPLLLKSIRVTNKNLTKKYKKFLENKAKEYFQLVFNPETHLVRKDKIFSSIKDNAKRKSACYDNSMLSMLSDELDALNLENPFTGYNIKKNIKNNFWQGNYFLDDLSGKKHIAADAQVFPFWCGVFKDKTMLKKALNAIQKEGLDKPMPLKYTIDASQTELIFPLNIVLSDYETNTVWLHLGLCFLDVAETFGIKKYLEKYTRLIEKHKTFPELLEPDGRIFQRFHYASDEGMLWCSKFLYLKQKS